jgi:hypothetical protein
VPENGRRLFREPEALNGRLQVEGKNAGGNDGGAFGWPSRVLRSFDRKTQSRSAPSALKSSMSPMSGENLSRTE